MGVWDESKSKFFAAVNSQQILHFRPGDFGFDDCLQSAGQGRNLRRIFLSACINRSRADRTVGARYTLSAKLQHPTKCFAKDESERMGVFRPVQIPAVPGGRGRFQRKLWDARWRRNAGAYVSFWSPSLAT